MGFIVVSMAEDGIGRMEVIVREQVVVAFGVMASSAVQSPAARPVNNTRMCVLFEMLSKIAPVELWIYSHYHVSASAVYLRRRIEYGVPNQSLKVENRFHEPQEL